MIQRHLTPSPSQSFFLFGPRGTGKTTFLKKQWSKRGNHRLINLLDPEQEQAYALDRGLLYRELVVKKNKNQWVVIDEIQKLPFLLDTVHRLIEESPLKFALTGSSARKLKRGGANLLAGRAFVNHMFPFTHLELKESFDLMAALA
jgi:predicted AAA+ superfamily ATPase